MAFLSSDLAAFSPFKHIAFRHFRRTSNATGRRVGLWVFTSLFGSLLGSPVLAQVTIDGTAETLIGGGGGTLADPLVVGADLVIGQNLAGSSLTISNGGTVTIGDDGILGNNVGSHGTVTVTGTGSTWTTLSETDVASQGTAVFNLENSGTVNSDITWIGYHTTSTGTINVQDAGSVWNNTAYLHAGVQGGTAIVNITNGGVINSQDVAIGAWEVGGIRANGTINISGAGSALNVTNDNIAGYQGIGVINIYDGGTLNDFDTYLGGTATGSGTVNIAGASSSWINTTSIAVGYDGVGVVNITNGSTVSANIIELAERAGSTGTINIGAASGNAAIAPGSLTATSGIAFGAGTGALIFNHTGTAYTFAPDISGAGTVLLESGNTTFTGNHTHTGGTTLTGGTLNFNGSGTSNITANGGTIGGSGTFGNLGINAGATLAPGNSIGTLNVANATLASGSILEVEVDDTGASDLLSATGTVTIQPNVTVNVTPENGTDTGATYSPNTIYTIATATGGLAGTFTTLNESFAFLDGALSYDANNAYLTLSRNAAALASVAATPDEIATATAIEALGAGNPVYDGIIPLGTADVNAAFRALEGEVHASNKGTSIANSGHTRNAALTRHSPMVS